MRIDEWLGKDNQLGIDIWHKKYQYGNESFDEWLERVSGGNIPVKKLIQEKKFLFGGRILSNRGVPGNVTYSNCYVITPPEDNLESIFDTGKKLARTYSYGGGCGIDISKLAPKGAKVNNTAKETSGSVSFMELYSLITGLIGQNGRRGALILSIDCNHPDLEEFIEIKSDLDKVTKANISIRMTDEFMEAVNEKRNITLKFSRPETGESITKVVNAYKIFRKICEMNWDYAEPGILFWDAIEDWHMMSNNPEFEYAGVNPCAEEPLPAGSSCLLGSLNLSEFVYKPFTSEAYFNYNEFRKAINTAVWALNDVLEEGLPLHPLEEQRESVEKWKQIGLGIFGLADMLIKMNYKYGEDDCIEYCDILGDIMTTTAIETSCEIARKTGIKIDVNPELIIDSPFFQHHATEATFRNVQDYGIANSQLLTIAPTGTLSSMLGVSGGIEPIYANYYTRKTESLYGEDKYYKVYTPIVKQYMEKFNITDDKDLPDCFVTSQDLDYKKRIAMQATWQRHIDASISSTINVPNDFTVEQIEDAYLLAWEEGLKGVTIFRDGCAREGILTIETENKKQDNAELNRGDWAPKPADTIYYERKIKIGCGRIVLFIGWSESEQKVVDFFVKKSGNGGCEKLLETAAITFSAIFRLGGNVNNIKKALRGVGSCPSFATARSKGAQLSKGNNCGCAIINEIEAFLKEKNISEQEPINNKIAVIHETVIKTEKCPECGEEVIFTGGCITCPSCGYSKCN